MEQAGINNNHHSFKLFRTDIIFRKVKQLFPNLASAVKNAPVVTGVRVPDDETDLVVHRGGRFINNMYVPDPIMEKNSVAQIPGEVVITAELGPNNYQLGRSGRSYQVCVS